MNSNSSGSPLITDFYLLTSELTSDHSPRGSAFETKRTSDYFPAAPQGRTATGCQCTFHLLSPRASSLVAMTTRPTNHGGETISVRPIGKRECQANQRPPDVIGRGEEGGRDMHREKEREREGRGRKSNKVASKYGR